MAQKPIRVAHRGASGYEPENTLAAFKKAIDIGADMIELDIRVCKSGELVVMHDETVDRMTNGKGEIAQMTLTELKSLQMLNGERIPTLEEVIDLAQDHIKLDIEIKGKNIAAPLRALLEEHIDKGGWTYKDFMVCSFHHQELKKLKKIDPEIRIGVLSEVVPPELLSSAKKMKAFSVNVPIDKIDSKFVKSAHKQGLKVLAYAANNTPEIDKAKQLKVDYICSDFPDKI